MSRIFSDSTTAINKETICLFTCPARTSDLRSLRTGRGCFSSASLPNECFSRHCEGPPWDIIVSVLRAAGSNKAMWKRLNAKDRQFDRAVGSPTLIETTADQNILRNSTNINNGSFSISSKPAFGRRGTADVLKGLPAVPLYVYIPTFSMPKADIREQRIANSRSW